MQESIGEEIPGAEISADGQTVVPAQLASGTNPALSYIRSETFWLVLGLLVLFIYRLCLMKFLPLADTTEARYGEIARQTVTNGFWLMHHMDPHTPFFAKPPLSTWASAVSMTLFGISEFTARLPSMLEAIVALLIGAQFAKMLGIRNRLLVAAVAASCPLFFISAGAVMTDAMQMLVVLAAQFAAWKVLDAIAQGQSPHRWRLAFWVLIGIGALSKGLATWALVGMPIFAYGVLMRRPLQTLLQLFDWVGILLCALVCVPWYLTAEHYYPGFLNYFIVGEHFSRFLVPGWTGDRYGTAHREAIGEIWLYWLAAVLPWIGVFLAAAWAYVRKPRGQTLPLETFLWCATIVPLAFFTFSRNIIWTYGLTAVVPFTVLVAYWVESRSPSVRLRICIAFACVAIATVFTWPVIRSNVDNNSDRDLVAAFVKAAPPEAVLLYGPKPSFSVAFYAHERVQHDPAAIQAENGKTRYVVIENGAVAQELALSANNVVLYAGTRHSLLKIH